MSRTSNAGLYTGSEGAHCKIDIILLIIYLYRKPFWVKDLLKKCVYCCMINGVISQEFCIPLRHILFLTKDQKIGYPCNMIMLLKADNVLCRRIISAERYINSDLTLNYYLAKWYLSFLYSQYVPGLYCYTKINYLTQFESSL